MPSNLFAGPHLWILLIVILLLFGAAKLLSLIHISEPTRPY